MKVLLILPQPFFAVRGSPINIRQVCTTLGELGHRVDLVAYHLGEEIQMQNVRIRRCLKIPFIRYVPVGPSCRKAFLDIFVFLEALKLLIRNRYDCIHAVEEAVAFAVVLGRIFHIPVIYDMDSDMPDQLAYTRFVRSRLLLKLAKYLERKAIEQ